MAPRLQAPAEAGARYHALTELWPSEAAGLRRVALAANGCLVALYQAHDAGQETDPACRWSTVCEEHSCLVFHETRELADGWLLAPEQWCEACMVPPAPGSGEQLRQTCSRCLATVGTLPDGTNPRPYVTELYPDPRGGADRRFHRCLNSADCDRRIDARRADLALATNSGALR